jgi:crotonobetainyl-CoA:carnitine CoA-transferase CaiB-like acyl-CoA transferase
VVAVSLKNVEGETEDGDPITAPDVPMKLGSAEPERGATPPALGEHTAEVLDDAGYEPEEVADLFERGVVVGPEN